MTSRVPSEERDRLTPKESFHDIPVTASHSERIRRHARKFNEVFIKAHVYSCFEQTDVIKLVRDCHGQLQETLPPKSIRCVERMFGAKDTGAVLGESVAEILEEEYLKPIILKTSTDTRAFEFLVDYYGARSNFLLEYNKEVEDCIENKCLRKVYEALNGNDKEGEENAVVECLNIFLPHVLRETEERRANSIGKATLSDRYRRKEISEVQLKTIRNRGLCCTVRMSSFNYPLSEPIENPCPNIPLLRKDEIELLDEIAPQVLKVGVDGKIYCLKFDHRKELKREVSLLSKMPVHPSLPRLIGVVDAGEGQVDQFLIPLISGQSLASFRTSTKEQKEKWKAQILEAVQVLHKSEIVWGDVHPRNVMIEKGSDRAILIDFGNDYNKEFVEWELRGTKAGDLQGVENLSKYIDNMN